MHGQGICKKTQIFLRNQENNVSFGKVIDQFTTTLPVLFCILSLPLIPLFLLFNLKLILNFNRNYFHVPLIVVVP